MKLPLDQQLSLVIDRLSGVENVALRNALAQQVMGKAAGDALYLVAEGSEAFKRATEEAQAFGTALNRVDAAKIEMANDAVHRAQESLKGIFTTIAVNVAPVSVGISKRLLWRDPPPTRDEVLDLETRLQLHVMGAPDAREGVMAFLERREPQWSMTLERDWPEWLDDEGSSPK